VAERGLGSEAHILLSSIALFAITNTVLITLVAGSRIFYGMAKEKVFPAILEKVHFKTKTPWIAVIIILIISIAFTLIGDIVIVANITVFAIVITFAAVNLAVIVLRYTEPNIERKFKVPINIGKFPILPLFGLGISVYMAFQFEIEVVLVGMGIIGIGAIFYKISKSFKPKFH
jgi:APA family basic amino acid/polyamine antiporter